MKQVLKSFLLQASFWLIYFGLARLIFIIYNLDFIRLEDAGLLEIVSPFYYAIHLDLATVCYFMMLPFLLLLIQSLWAHPFLNILNQIYTGFAIAVYSLITAGELGIYPEWKTKLTYKALKYLQHPAEVYQSASGTTFLGLIFLFLVLSVTGYWIYHKFFFVRIRYQKPNYIFSTLFLCITPSILIIGARGGLQQIPINQSESYFSDKNILNLAAVNNAFNLYISIFENKKNFGINPFIKYDMKDAALRVESVYKPLKDTSFLVLKNPRPNIVILILESWSADLIESLGGKPGITPEFHQLEQEGLLFDNIYADGERSEQAMASILAGFPAHPISSLTVQPDKFSKVPTLTQTLKSQGYSSSFYFGGQLIYGNIKAFIHYNGFDRIREVYDFGEEIPKGKLGVHDEFVLTRQYEELNQEKEPFFSVLFTLSSHSPYDQPLQNGLKWDLAEKQYVNSVFYTDKCLGDYFRKVKNEPWYDNTLFILVADHSHNSYYNWPSFSPKFFRIPMLWIGGVLKKEFSGEKIGKIGSQSGIIGTLLPQLGLENNKFRWSKNLLNPYTPEFAFFSLDNGFGYVQEQGYFVYDTSLDRYHEISLSQEHEESFRKDGFSILQVLFQEYMDY